MELATGDGSSSARRDHVEVRPAVALAESTLSTLSVRGLERRIVVVYLY